MLLNEQRWASIVLLVVIIGCARPQNVKTSPAASPTVASGLVELSVPPLPEWTDRYADGKKGDVRFFNITKLMKTYSLTRVQAVELQNQYRDLTRADKRMIGKPGFDQALQSVRQGHFESKLDLAALDAAKFVVVFDLDETLFDQYYSLGKTCRTHEYKTAAGKTKYVHMAPGWQELLRRIRKLGGAIVLFSANLDDRTRELLSHVSLDDKPLLGHPWIGGVLTNSYLIQQEKTEPPGSSERPRKGRPVIEPSKDLRFFDENMDKVIIVDDNPLRLFQFGHARIFKKFDAQTYCTTQNETEKSAFNLALAQVGDEIEWAFTQQSKSEKLSFVQAYRPFTVLGQITVNWLMGQNGWNKAQAYDFILRHPEVVDSRF